MFRPLLLLSGLVLAFYPLAHKIVGDGDWAWILLTIFVLGFFFQKDFFIAVSILVAATVLILISSLIVLKRKFRVLYLSLSLTLIAFSLVAIQSIVLLTWIKSIPYTYYQAMASRANSLSIPLSEPTSGLKPDIYYIVLDSYAGADVLKEFYGYDNSSFLNDLENLGFVVPKTVLSNYPRTALSVSSTLDMQYWDSTALHMENVIYWWPVKPVLNHSRARASLESIGYQSVSIASDWEMTNNVTTDYYFRPYPVILTDYEEYIFRSTPLEILHSPFQEFAPLATNDVHRRFISFSMETLTKTPEIPGPKFVFVHLILPHTPFVFNADGSPIDSNSPFTFQSPVGMSLPEYRQRYIGQIEYINSQLRFVIETILDKSTTPPIIILQADHGPGLSVISHSSESSCLKARFSAFGAYYLAGMERKDLPQDLTPVNLFRIIFNEYFGANLELLENHQFYTKGDSMFAGLHEVTQQVKDTCIVPPAEE